MLCPTWAQSCPTWVWFLKCGRVDPVDTSIRYVEEKKGRPPSRARGYCGDHIRIDAKRQALDALDNSRRGAEKNGDGDANESGGTNGDGPETPNNGAEIPLLVALAAGLRHNHVTVCVWRDLRPPLNC